MNQTDAEHWQPIEQDELIYVAYLMGAHDAFLHGSEIAARLHGTGQHSSVGKWLVQLANWMEEARVENINKPHIKRLVRNTVEPNWDGEQ